MQLILPNGVLLRGDLVPLLIQRTDLTAVPSTLEFLVRVDDELAEFIAQGQLISFIDKAICYRIIYTLRQNDHSLHQGNPNFTLTKVIAILEGVHQIAFAREKAVIKENSTLGAIYRACGATMAIDTDIAVDKFTCLVGEPPSFSLQKAMQRSASVVVWNGTNTLAFKRISDLFQQKPVEVLPKDITQEFSSGFIERHEIPAFFTNQADGSLAKSSNTKTRGADFEMFANKQILNNLSTYLLQKKIWTTRLMPNVNAGDVIEVEKQPYVVITAAHLFSQSGSGSGSQLSRFWLGSLSRSIDKYH